MNNDLISREAFEKAYQALEERPQGEWLWLGDSPNPNHKWSCNKCGRGVKEQENFCPNCGVKMQKGGAELATKKREMRFTMLGKRREEFQKVIEKYKKIIADDELMMSQQNKVIVGLKEENKQLRKLLDLYEAALIKVLKLIFLTLPGEERS